MGDTVNKMTCKMEETDPWFEDKIVQLDALESQLKKLYTLTEALAFSRREMAIATGQFAGTIIIFFCQFYFQKQISFFSPILLQHQLPFWQQLKIQVIYLGHWDI